MKRLPRSLRGPTSKYDLFWHAFSANICDRKVREDDEMDVEEDEELVGFARFSGFEMRRVAASPVSMEPYMCLLHWYCI